MRGLAMVACALVLTAGTARADLVLGGSADARSALDAGVVDDGITPELVQVCLGQGHPPAECARRCLLGPSWALYGADYAPDAGAAEAKACSKLAGFEAGSRADGGLALDAGTPVDAGPLQDVPIQLAQGQPAPAPGWWLSDALASSVVVQGQACRQVLQEADAPDAGSSSYLAPALAGAATFALGVAAGVYLHQRATH